MSVAELKPPSRSGGSQQQRPPAQRFFERRRSERVPLCERALVALRSEDAFARLVGVELLDVSIEGMGMFSSEALPLGESCTILREEGNGQSREAVVARCTPCEDGYIIGVTTSDLLAA